MKSWFRERPLEGLRRNYCSGELKQPGDVPSLSVKALRNSTLKRCWAAVRLLLFRRYRRERKKFSEMNAGHIDKFSKLQRKRGSGMCLTMIDYFLHFYEGCFLIYSFIHPSHLYQLIVRCILKLGPLFFSPIFFYLAQQRLLAICSPLLISPINGMNLREPVIFSSGLFPCKSSIVERIL